MRYKCIRKVKEVSPKRPIYPFSKSVVGLGREQSVSQSVPKCTRTLLHALPTLHRCQGYTCGYIYIFKIMYVYVCVCHVTRSDPALLAPLTYLSTRRKEDKTHTHTHTHYITRHYIPPTYLSCNPLRRQPHARVLLESVRLRGRGILLLLLLLSFFPFFSFPVNQREEAFPVSQSILPGRKGKSGR